MTATLDRVTTSTAVEVDDGALRGLVAGWLLAQQSVHTRRAYGRDLVAWRDWLADRGVGVLDAERAHVDGWARAMVEQDGRAASTVARRLAALSSFYGYAVDEGAVSVSPVARVKRPRVSGDSQTLGLDKAEALRLVEAAAAIDARAELLVRLLLVTGLRVGEALGLRVEDVEMVRGHCTVRVAGKGGRVDRVVLPPVVCDAIDRAADGRTTGPLFVTSTGAAMRAEQATRIVKRAARAAGVEGRVSPHSLRHTAVTLALDAGVPLRDVQDFARHADPRTTRRYDRARGQLDRSPAYVLAGVLAGGE